jgi:hypothetical protein
MTIKWKKLLLTAFGTLLALTGAGYWYVFVAGAPEFDPPQTEAVGADLIFKLESFRVRRWKAIVSMGSFCPPITINNLNSAIR